MADPPAADDHPLDDDPWDPLQAEYDDLRQQERERNHRVYLKRIKRELGRPRPYPSHGEVYDPKLDWPERYTDGPM